MNARTPCPVSAADARRAEQESLADARAQAIDELADEIGNDLEVYIKRRWGVCAWSAHYSGLCHELAEVEYPRRVEAERTEAAMEKREERMG